MAHVHLEDGSFTLLWVILWSLLALALVGLCIVWLRKVRRADSRSIIVASMLTAAAFAVFQIEIPILNVHLSFTPLIGILAGPALGSIVLLIANIFSAAIGHGGWGLIGANMIVNLTEVTAGYLVYQIMAKRLKINILYSAGVAAFVGLFLGNAVMMGIILVSGIEGKEVVLAELSLIAAGNLVMAVVEAFVTAYIVAYIRRVRPDMLGIRNKGIPVSPDESSDPVPETGKS